jgi:hypothetical protein
MQLSWTQYWFLQKCYIFLGLQITKTSSNFSPVPQIIRLKSDDTTPSMNSTSADSSYLPRPSSLIKEKKRKRLKTKKQKLTRQSKEGINSSASLEMEIEFQKLEKSGSLPEAGKIPRMVHNISKCNFYFEFSFFLFFFFS